MCSVVKICFEVLLINNLKGKKPTVKQKHTTKLGVMSISGLCLHDEEQLHFRTTVS